MLSLAGCRYGRAAKCCGRSLTTGPCYYEESMDAHEIALILALTLPVAMLMLLRINAALVFLSLCLGLVLVEFVAGEANSLLTLFGLTDGSVSGSTLQLVLLFAPAAATSVISAFSLHGKLRVLFNLVPATAAAAFAVILVVPLLPPGLSGALQDQSVWQHLSRAQALVVGTGALVSLAFLWTQRRSLRHRDKRKH